MRQCSRNLILSILLQSQEAGHDWKSRKSLRWLGFGKDKKADLPGLWTTVAVLLTADSASISGEYRPDGKNPRVRRGANASIIYSDPRHPQEPEAFPVPVARTVPQVLLVHQGPVLERQELPVQEPS